VEVLQILRALRIEGYGWQSHPAVMMWRGHVEALVAYAEACNADWEGRGHRDTTRLQILEFAPSVRDQPALAAAGLLPPWLGDDELHRSHQSALVRKNPEHYRRFFPNVPDDLPYLWPAPPPAAKPVEYPFSAWVVRAPTAELLGAFLEYGVVAIERRPEDDAPRRRTKRHRNLRRFAEALEPGDAVAVPLGDRELLVGEIEGGYTLLRLPPLSGRHHARRVRWRGFLPRSSLRDPAALQDPQLVFALHGEDALTRTSTR
jgi:hypothetical protein